MAPQAKLDFDMFLSYSRNDAARVSALQKALTFAGFSVWQDTGQIVAGDAFIRKIEEGLTRSRCVVVFCSTAALASSWVQREWNVALTLNTRIIPVRLDDSDVPVMLRALDFIDLRDLARLDEAVREIAEALAGTPEVPATSPSRASDSNPSVLGGEVVIINRMIARAEHTAAYVRTARWAVVPIGATLSIAAVVTAPVSWAIMASVGSMTIAGTLAYAFNARLDVSRREVERLSSLRDAIELYCPSQPACLEFRVKLESRLKQAAGLQEHVA